MIFPRFNAARALAAILLLSNSIVSNSRKNPSWLGPQEFSIGTVPSPRGYFGFAAVKEMLFVFGGGRGTIEYLNDLYMLDPDSLQWTELSSSTSGGTPSRRAAPGFTQLNDKLYLFGGGYGYGKDFQDLGDLHIFDPATLQWTDLTGSMRGALPPPRQAAGALVAAQGMLYLLGGCQALTTGDAICLSDAHSFDPRTLRWTNLTVLTPAIVATAAPSPPARIGHAAAAVGSDPGGIYTFGGCVGCGQSGRSLFEGVLLDDLHRLDLATNTWAVAGSRAGGAAPSPRAFHGLAAAAGRLFVFGGFGTGGLLGDAHAYDPTAGGAWTELSSAADGGSRPAPRVAPGFTAAGGRLFVLGGFSRQIQVFDDLHELDPASESTQPRWHYLSRSLQGEVPAARSGHGFAAAGGMAYVFGGLSHATGGQLNDLHAFDPRSLRTDELTARALGAPPQPRGCPGFASLGGDLYVHGGYTVKSGRALVFGDLHRFSPATMAWSNLSADIGAPSARALHGFVATRGRLYVFGGAGAVDAGNGSASDFNDLHSYDPSARQWTNLGALARGRAPTPRMGHGFAPAAGRLFVFGGCLTDSGSYLNDLHVFDPVMLEWWELSNSTSGKPPSPRCKFGFAAASGRLYIFGGASLSSASGKTNELYVLDTASLEWSASSSRLDGGVPSPRSLSQLVYVGSKICIFGGQYKYGTGEVAGGNDFHCFLASRDFLWSQDIGLSMLLQLFDWDTVALSGVVRLTSQLVLCTNELPCRLFLHGYGARLVLTGNASIICHARVGCVALELDSVSLYCEGGHSQQSAIEVQGASSLDVTNSSFLGCSSPGDGGAVMSYDGPLVNITNSTFQNLQSTGFGGAVSTTGGYLVVTNSSFLNCTSAKGGGAIFVGAYKCYGSGDAVGSVLDVRSSGFLGCKSSGDGGAIMVTADCAAHVISSNFVECETDATGGAIYTGNAAFLVVDSTFFVNNSALGQGGGAIAGKSSPIFVKDLICSGNIAGSGGGGVLYWKGNPEPVIEFKTQDDTYFDWKTLPPTTCRPSGSGLSGLTSIELALCGAGNTAAYGPCISTPFSKMLITGMPTQANPVFPGLSFQVAVLKKDAYNQTIVTDSLSVVLVQTGLNGDRSVQDPLVTVSGNTVVQLQAGLGLFSLSLKPTFSSVDPTIGTTEIERLPMIYFYGTDLETLLPIQSDLLVVAFANGSSVCPQGYILALSSSTSSGSRGGSCMKCPAGTYSLAPLIGINQHEPSCLKCPVGAKCEGGNQFMYSLGTWTTLKGMYRLIGCPTGHQLIDSVGGKFSNEIQQCLACPTDQYIISPNNSNSSCKECPGWAICNNSKVTGRVFGSSWDVDVKTWQYVLRSCPMGYELATKLSSTSPECVVCPAGYYCNGGSLASVACPEGSFALAGANSSELCHSAVFVVSVITMVISPDEFASQRLPFQAAVAAAARITADRVVIFSIARRSDLPTSLLQVTVKLAAADANGANSVKDNLNTFSLNTQLGLRNLPDATVKSVSLPGSTVVENATPLSIIIGASISGFVLLAIMAFVGSYLWTKLRKQAAHKAFLSAFHSATAGTAACKNQLPWQLGDDYIADKVLGKGAFGCIVQVRAKQGNHMAAIKLLVPEKRVFDEKDTRQLQREAHVLELLTQAKCEDAVHLTGVRSVGMLPEVCWFVMELLLGQDLDTVLRDDTQGPLSDVECIKVARAVLAVLKAMHAEGLVHRDVKPANVMNCRAKRQGKSLDEGEQSYKLLDFGTSLGVDEALAKETMMTLGSSRERGAGTPPYMSPEMFKEPWNARYPTDLWSLGVTLFETTTGVLPFEAESDLLWGFAIAGNMEERAPSLLDRLGEDRRPGFDHGLARVVARALEKRVGKRYASADEMHEAVHRCLIDRGEAVYSAFVSYRVASEGPLARLLFDDLNHTVTPGGHRVTVYWDAHRLVRGESWEEGFATGLLHSLVALPLLSYGATAPLATLPKDRRAAAAAEGWEERPVGRPRLEGADADWEDNLLKELLIAGALLDRRGAADRAAGEGGLLQAIYPVLIGRPHPPGHPGYPGMGSFFLVQGGGGQYPAKPSPPTSAAVERFLGGRAGVPAATAAALAWRSVGEAVRRLTGLQGCQLWSHPAGLVEAELTREQQELVGRGYAGPALELGGTALTTEQRVACEGGLDERQLRMLKAQIWLKNRR